MEQRSLELGGGLFRPDLRRLHENLTARIRGQPQVLSRLVEALHRRELDAVPQRGSRDAFFFAGPTGVGKTETVLNVAELLFGTGRFQRFDSSEFETPEATAFLLGNRTGDSGRFGQVYAKCPAGIWLFDEFEKGHSKFVDLFLQMTEVGRITLANGETLDLSRIYLFATSNLGSTEILGRVHLPFASLERHVTRCVRRHLRPELLARFGPPFVFRPLSRAIQEEIVEQKLEDFLAWQRCKGRRVTCDAGVLRLLQRRGFSPKEGARPLIRLIEELCGNPICQERLAGKNGDGRLEVEPGGNSLRFAK